MKNKVIFFCLVLLGKSNYISASFWDYFTGSKRNKIERPDLSQEATNNMLRLQFEEDRKAEKEKVQKQLKEYLSPEATNKMIQSFFEQEEAKRKERERNLYIDQLTIKALEELEGFDAEKEKAIAFVKNKKYPNLEVETGSYKELNIPEALKDFDKYPERQFTKAQENSMEEHSLEQEIPAVEVSAKNNIPENEFNMPIKGYGRIGIPYSVNYSGFGNWYPTKISLVEGNNFDYDDVD